MVRVFVLVRDNGLQLCHNPKRCSLPRLVFHLACHPGIYRFSTGQDAGCRLPENEVPMVSAWSGAVFSCAVTGVCGPLLFP